MPFLASDVTNLSGAIPASQSGAALQQPGGLNLPALPGKAYAALALVITVSANMTVQFFSMGSNQALTPVLNCEAGTPMVLPYNPYGWFQTNPGETYGVTTSSGGQADILMTSGKIYDG